MYGVNINCKHIDFIRMILSGEKVVETRNTNSLKRLVGHRIGLIRTGCGKAMLVGYATITEIVVYDPDSFRSDFKRHRVPSGCEYDIRQVKYGYVLSDVVPCDPTIVTSRGIVYRSI